MRRDCGRRLIFGKRSGEPLVDVWGRASWTLSRLKVMSPSEVGFRVGRKLQGTVERAGIGLARPSAPTGGCGKPWVGRLPLHFDVEPYRRAADRILDGAIDSLEPNRHLELVTLAQAWHLTRDMRYALGCRELLDTWFEQYPYPRGSDWRVSLQHAARLVNWSFAWFLLGGDESVLFADADGAAFRGRWLESVYQHCHFIPRHWSRHSSARCGDGAPDPRAAGSRRDEH